MEIAKVINLIWKLRAIVAIDGQIMILFENDTTSIATQHTDKDGYKYITVYNSGRRKNYKVHRLVGQAFLGLKHGQFINHINGVKDDNRLVNLEVCDHSHNMKHAVRTGLLTNCKKKGEAHNTAKHSNAEIAKIRALYKETGCTMRALAKLFNCSSGYISDVINMKIRVEE